jgi:hypothetical protein
MKGHLMIYIFSIILLLALSSPCQAQEPPLVLDCAITRLSPAYEHIFNSNPELKSMHLMKLRYELTIYPGQTFAKVSTPFGENFTARATESEKYYQIDFENKWILIDRLTGEFQLWKANHPRAGLGLVGYGTCNKIGGKI